MALLTRRAVVMLTPRGWGTLAAVVVTYACASGLGYAELGIVAAGGAVLLVACVVWGVPRPRLRVDREIAPLKVARGDPAVGVVTLVNVGRRELGGLRADEVCGAGTVSVDVPSLPRGGRRTVSYAIPTRRRGEVTVGPLRLLRSDPLGLVRRVAVYGDGRTLLVRPRTFPLPMLPSGRSRHLEGPTADNAVGGTVTFHALREYARGDDLRHVHWRSSARTGRLMVRRFVDAGLPHTTIVLDVRPDVYSGGDDLAELAVDVAASVAVAAGRHGFPVRILAGSRSLVRTRGGRNDVTTLLDALALVRPDPVEALPEALDALRGGPAGGVLIVVTGMPEPAEFVGLAGLRGRFDRAVVVRLGAAPGTALIPGATCVDAVDAASVIAAWQREAAR
ncbi:DUF58 domain-containing protein [Actinoallomurus sp. NPDC052308]|uniref:DUF58 domain-containing protein n=1 Tax=Actinoallomurus sp. NPDC052308 TaxID=3155530 RepID=UPI003438FD8E